MNSTTPETASRSHFVAFLTTCAEISTRNSDEDTARILTRIVSDYERSEKVIDILMNNIKGNWCDVTVEESKFIDEFLRESE